MRCIECDICLVLRVFLPAINRLKWKITYINIIIKYEQNSVYFTRKSPLAAAIATDMDAAIIVVVVLY